MKKWIVSAALTMLTMPGGVTAQSKDALVGTWKLVSATDTTEKGEVRDAYGRNPTGFLTYTADARMAVIITASDRKRLSINDRLAVPADERAEAFATLIAYAGRYNFTDDKVTHHVEAASFQNWVGTDLVRTAKLDGDRLILWTPPLLKGGKMLTTELIWQRWKPDHKEK